MAENATAEPTTVDGPFRTDTDGAITVEWDVPIEVSDGIVLRADVFRPTEPGTYPVVLSMGPYGKGLPFQRAYAQAWELMVAKYPEVTEGSSGKYANFEAVDPEKWVPDGYVCVRVDARGSGRSPGYLEFFSEREIQDLYECIEWAAIQPWSTGRVGLNGISYLAINQWYVAALRPPHLAAICVWEALADRYRDATYHGGIWTDFTDIFFGAVTASTQYGLGEQGGRNPITGQLICGDETLTDEERAARRADYAGLAKEHPYFDDFHRARNPDWSRIEVPVLSAGNWGGQGLHLRGNTRGFEQVASAEKWLEMHDDTHWCHFYTDYGVALQKRFLGHFLKGEYTGWDTQPRVQLRTRRADGGIVLRTADDWPLPETHWTRLYLDASDGSLNPGAVATEASASYDGMTGRIGFGYTYPEDVEIIGPVAARLYVESSTADADLFLVVRAFAPDGAEIVFQGAIDPNTAIAQGWLRVSQRALDPVESRPFLPVHTHERAEPMTPGTIYEVDVEILPTSLALPSGYTLTLDVQGHDYIHPPATDTAGNEASMGTALTGCGPFIHVDPVARPANVYGGEVTVHTGGRYGSYLLLPVIPSKVPAPERDSAPVGG